MSILALSVMAPFLLKVSGTGFVHPDWARSEKCEVFNDHVLMTRSYARESLQYIFPYRSENAVLDLIGKAMEEEVEQEPNYMCDGPATYIKATVQKDGVDQDLVLYSTGGCGSPKIMRQGPNTSALIDIESTFCPTTH
jgi:hypothetical protein